MLKFKLRQSNQEEFYKEIILEDIFLGKDGSFISGVVTSEDTLLDGQNIFVSFEGSDKLYPREAKVESIVRDGFVLDDQYKYEITTFITKNGNKYNGIWFEDGCFYPSMIENDEDSEYYGEEIVKIGADDHIVYLDASGSSYVQIPKIYYVENGKLEISGNTYDIDVDSPIIQPTVSILEDVVLNTYRTLNITLFPNTAKRKIYKVILHNTNGVILDLDTINYTDEFKYITIGNIASLSDDSNDDKIYSLDQQDVYFTKRFDGNNEDIITLNVYGSDETFSANTNDVDITISGRTYEIKKTWKNSLYSDNYLNLFVKDNTISLEQGDIIYVKSNKPNTQYYDIIDGVYIVSENGEMIFGEEDVSGNTIFKYGQDLYKQDYVLNEGNAVTYYVELDDEETHIYSTIEGGKMKFLLPVGNGEYEYTSDVDFDVQSVSFHGKTYQISSEENSSVTFCQYANINGVKYFVEDDLIDFIEIGYNFNGVENVNLQEFELTKISTFKNGYYAYYMNGDTAIPVKISVDESGNTTVEKYSFDKKYFTSSDYVSYNLVSKKYLLYKGERIYLSYIDAVKPIDFILSANTLDQVEIVYVNDSQNYELEVIGQVGSSCYRCYAQEKGVVNIIKNNYEDYTFYLKDSVYPMINVYEPNVSQTMGNDGFNKHLSFYITNSYYTLPIGMANTVATNALQEKVVERDFFQRIIDDYINRIVDMEKDVYYPAFCGADETKMVDEIEFKLHFRTRNLNDWSINEDRTKDYIEAKAENSEATIPNSIKACNWNIIDYYYDDLNDYDIEISEGKDQGYFWDEDGDNGDDEYGRARYKVKKITNEGPHTYDCKDNTYYRSHITKYEQPADLVYFLNFTDNDILYQKSKVGKSFLRLLFYDTDDPKTQSLLAMSTVFFDSDKLYKHYLDNANPDTHDDYGFVNISNGEYTEYCGVEKEPYYLGDDGIFTYNEDFRISATFTIKNMFEEDRSSEGFYLYLFKEYTSNLHERNIYLKIQFNHAGEGKVVNFLVPTKQYINEDKEEITELLDITNKDDREEFKKGYPMDELYSKLYIPIKVKFDDEKKKFVYCFPEYMMNPSEPHRVVFNLYEPKIKDESIKDEED